MRLGLRTRIFLSVFSLVLLVVLGTGFVVSYTLQQEIVVRIEEELERHAAIAVHVVGRGPEVTEIPVADELADRLGAAAGARVTIIAADGRVLGDSELTVPEVEAVENHGGRPEVVAAFAAGTGNSRRYSTTLEREMLYVAHRYERGGEAGVMRVSRPLAELEAAVAQLRGLLALGGLVALILGLGASAVSTYYFARSLHRMVDFAQQLATGEKRGTLSTPGRDALGGLAGSLNRLSEQLEGHVATLASERDRFGAVLDGLTDAVMALDDEQRVTLINRAGILLLGLSREPVGSTLLETIRAPELHELVTTPSEGTGRLAEETVEFDLPGDPRPRIQARATRPRTGGVVLVLRDVTELRRLETVRRDFVSNVSHELRTPVSIIRANSETLLDGALEEQQMARRFLGSILENAERLSSLIADLLDISRIEAGRYELGAERLPVGRALRRAAAALETRAIEKEFTIQVEPSGELEVLGDAGALDQVLYNLIDNAVKYAPAGGQVTLRAAVRDGRVRVEVEDDGPGVPAEHRERLFERFFRVDPGRSREMGGTGLGLAIVKHLVQAMGGEVGMEPAAERGSIFWFTLRPA